MKATQTQTAQTQQKIDEVDRQLAANPANPQLKNDKAILVSFLSFLKNKNK